MEYVNFSTPPYPHFIIAGSALYRPGDAHGRRSNIGSLNSTLYRIRRTLYYRRRRLVSSQGKRTDYFKTGFHPLRTQKGDGENKI